MLQLRRALALPIVIGSLLCGAPAASSADETTGPFACTFDRGASWSYDAGKFSSVPPVTLSFEIDGVDLDGQKARLVIGGKTSGPLRIIRALNANHYLEVANEGFLNLTTIYDRDESTSVHPAVHSRHFGILGQPDFAQYAGTCSVKAEK